MTKQDFLREAIIESRVIETCIYNAVFREYCEKFHTGEGNTDSMYDFKKELYIAIETYGLDLEQDFKGEHKIYRVIYNKETRIKTSTKAIILITLIIIWAVVKFNT